MGTRSITRVVDASFNRNEPLIAMYRQMDGYPSGHGAELAEFLKGMVVVNGYGNRTPPRAANGAGCLAAQMVAHFKDGIGRIYINQPNCENEEYNYTITVAHDAPILVKCQDSGGRVLFDGDASEFADFCKRDGEE